MEHELPSGVTHGPAPLHQIHHASQGADLSGLGITLRFVTISDQLSGPRTYSCRRDLPILFACLVWWHQE